MDDRFYPCIFSMNDYSETDNVLDYVSYYRFKSVKSKLFYIIRVEAYRDHVYGVKFFLKSMLNSPKKYILANRNTLADKPFFTEELLENFVTRFIVEEPEHDIQL